ncbi:hypothetical protein WA026_020730 [Henosepilachna vigintioctopunctata]|uniref:Uncharacterized protein n=1 Tax=Henosepilachna vigintioctopunctata TaxID=420089 RepID=A0AAW1UD86_9CUCU
MKKDDGASKTLNTRIFSAPEPINSKHSEGDSSRFISSVKELLEEKSMLAKSSINKSSAKHSVSDEIYGTQGDLSIVSTKPSNPKLFGSRFNRSPLIGPQYLQDTYANLRSVCGVIRTNDTCGKVTIKKITKKKKTLPKLTLMKCPSIAASLTKMKAVTLVPLKKSYEPQDPIRCEEKKDEICRRADDDWKLTAKPFSKIADCPKVTNVVQMKNCPPIARLAKTEIPEPLKKCKEATDLCAPRSDASLMLRKRDLPQIPCGTFCRPSLEFVPGEPFPRLKKFPLKDPPRICPKEEPICERIDENLQVKPKCLPELVLKCPPPIIEDKLIDCAKLKRPLARKVEVVRKPCIKPPGPCDNPIRADDNKKFGPKKLPKYEASKCKLVCVPPDLKEGETLQRPKKQYDPRDPIRKCKTSLKCTRDRIPVEPKILPKVECTGQATYPPVVLTEGVPIKRMEKKKIPDPERICPMKHICDTKRADAKLSVKKSCLPRLITKCPAPPQYIPEMKKCPLKRLPKVVLEEPKKICPETTKECIRADEPYKEIKKCLPIFKSSECPMDISPVEIKDSPALKRLCPRKISQSRDCPTKQVEKCIRSDMDDWDYIIERSCYPFQDKCRQKNSGNVNTKRSMSTNLTSQLNKGLLHRRAQLSHIDVRKRFSTRNGNFETENQRFDEIMKAEMHTSSPQNCEKDPMIQNELQPKYPLYRKFEGMEPIKPEAPILDASKEDECIREKYKIPYEGVTGTCDNPSTKRKFLRVQKNGRPEKNAPSCPKEVVKSCSSPATVSASSCDEVVKSCPSASSPPCPQTFSPKTPPPLSCPPICTRPKSCPKFKNVCGKKISLWQRIKNYFKARPNCPPPGAYKKKKLMKKVKKLADRAGLGVYDPCDDPKLICREVEKRCCLAKKSNCDMGKRCLHSFGALRLMYPISPIAGLLPINERIIERILILNRRISHTTSLSQRDISSWRNPYEFYNFDRECDKENLALCSSGPQERCCTYDDKAIHLYETYGGVDIDLLRENMYKILFITSLISSNIHDDEYEVEGNQVHDYGTESIESRKEILMEILYKIQQNLETISQKNLINWDEKDTTQKTIKVLGKILDSKHKR